jgi:hypothetical protein
MPIDHHFFSKRSFFLALALTAGAGFLSGCSSQVARLEDPPALRTAVADDATMETETAGADITVIVSAGAGDTPELRPGDAPAINSPWCQYLREDSAAEATVLRSPSLSGSVTEEGKASLNMGLSWSSFAKADLVEQSAEAKCRHYLAEKGLQKLLFVSPEGLSAAGFKAKSDSIFASRGTIARLREEIASSLESGDLDQSRATQLQIQADQLITDANAAKSNADRRLDAVAGRTKGAGGLSKELMRAEDELSDIASRMRTYDAMDVSVSAGWNDDVDDNGFDVANDSFGGKVSFSMKLGALNPARYRHEKGARDARVRSINEEEGGSLWQVAALRRAHENAISGLVESRAQLGNALAQAKSLVAKLNDADNPDFHATLIGAQLQVIRLRAEYAAVDSSIAEIKSNLERLQSG